MNNIITTNNKNQQQQQKLYWIPAQIGQNFFVHSIRYLIVIFSLVSFTLVSANTTSFSLTIICMIEGSNGNTTTKGENTACKEFFIFKFIMLLSTLFSFLDFKQLKYSPTERNSLFSAAAIGSIFNGLAITSLIGRFGLR